MTILITERHKVVVLIIFAIILVSTIVEGETLQKITFYTSRDKGLPSQSFQRREDITSGSLASTAGSYCVEEGLWVLTIRIGNHTFTEWIGGSVGGEICMNQPDSRRSYEAVRPVGEIDLENSALSLFPQVRWETEETKLVIEEDEHEANENLIFLSYVLTGTVSYEVFSEANFGGTSVCLEANVNSGSFLTYGISSNHSRTINYRSAHPGCGQGIGDGDGGNRTTTEPGGSGSLSQLSFPISKFFHSINLLILYFSRKIIF